MREFEPWPCDQLGADIYFAQRYMFRHFNIDCAIDIATMQTLIAEAEHYRAEQMEDPIAMAIDSQEPYLNDRVRECYLRALTKIIGRRIGFRVNQSNNAGKHAPFAHR